VIIIRKMAVRFISLYRDLLEIAGKLRPKDKQLHELMVAMEKHPKRKKRGFTAPQLKKVERLFDEADNTLRMMMKTLQRQQFNDLAALFKEARSLHDLSDHIKLSNLPETVKSRWITHLYNMVADIRDTVRHAWEVSKAQARDFTKLEEAIDLHTTKGNVRHIRRETIELDHVENRIADVKPGLLALLERADREPHQLTKEFEELLKEYQEEILLLKHIMHQSKILIHVVQHKVFSQILHEAEHLGLSIIMKKVQAAKKDFDKVTRQIENHMRRATIDIEKGILPKMSRGTGHLSAWERFRIWWTELFNPPKPAEEYK